MKRFGAIFYKEYLETRLETLIFLIVGACYYVAAFFFFDSYSTSSVGFLRLQPFLTAGIVALWLNATILSATAFARERETGSLETLRRIAPDWRIAAVAKFCYVFASTALLAAILFGVALCVDRFGGHDISTTLLSYFRTDLGGDLATFLRGSGLLVAFCWGVFWTGRVERQTTAIFLTVVCALASGLIATGICQGVWGGAGDAGDLSLLRLVLGFCLVLGLVALAFAPGRNRFGYRDDSARRPLGDDANRSDAALAVSRAALDDFKRRAAKRVKPWSFPAIVAHVLRESALLFRSPASILFELTILVFLAALLISTGTNYELFGKIAGSFFGAIYAVYFVSFASGLFRDAKRRDAPLKSRFGVGLWRYWLANALVAAGIVAVGLLLALYFDFELNDRVRGEIFDYPRSGTQESFLTWLFDVKPLRNFLTFAVPLATFSLGAALWSAAAPGGRLVSAARTAILVALALVATAFFNDLATLEAKAFFYGLGALFAFGSIPVVARSLEEKKSRLILAIPPATLAVALLALAFFAFSFQVFLPGLSAQNAPSTRPTPAVAATETVSTPPAATTTSPNDYPAQL